MKINQDNKNARIAKNRGITLIALVVTIVILIILATISIYAVLGENGIIKKAEKAKDAYEQAKQEEQDSLDSYAEYLGNYLNENSGTAIPLPDGFYYVGGNRTEGLVISDNSNDANKGTGYDTASTLEGNQFVWIPATEGELVRTLFDTTTGQPTDGLDTTVYTEPYDGGYSDEQGTEEKSEYDTMKAQVIKYGGFYIGRYEAGVNSTTLREKPTTEQTVVCKKGVAPYNYVPWGASMSDINSDVECNVYDADYNATGETVNSKGAVYLAQRMYQSSESVESTLCYGCQWDAICRYIGDANRTTDTKDKPELTGSVFTDVSKNIYDLAGNCAEWTMEVGDMVETRVIRGGTCKNTSSASTRGRISPLRSYDISSFRLTLYVK